MNLKQFLGIVNIRVQIVTLSPLLLGTLLAWSHGHPLAPLECIVLALSAFSIGMGTTALNSYLDFYHGVDSSLFVREPSKILVREKLAPGVSLLTALALFAVGTISGLMLSFIVGWQLILAGALSLAVAVFYSGGPLPISRTPFGELFVGTTQGSALFCLSYYVQTRAIPLDIIISSVPSGFFVALILTVNNTCDLVGDQHAGRRTLSILLGPLKSRLLVPLIGLIGYGSAVSLYFFGIINQWALLFVVAAVMASIPIFITMDKRGFSHATKVANMQSVSRIFLIFTFTMAGAILYQPVATLVS